MINFSLKQYFGFITGHTSSIQYMMLPLYCAKLVRMGLQGLRCRCDTHDTTCAVHIKWTYLLVCIAVTALPLTGHSSFWSVSSSFFELPFGFVKHQHCILCNLYFYFFFLTLSLITYKGNLDNLKSQIYTLSDVFLEALILRKTVR